MRHEWDWLLLFPNGSLFWDPVSHLPGSPTGPSSVLLQYSFKLLV
jgi:hypothetical protein